MPERNKRALIKSDQDQENALEQEQDGPVKWETWIESREGISI